MARKLETAKAGVTATTGKVLKFNDDVELHTARNFSTRDIKRNTPRGFYR